ncbi:MAG: hypothetical protein HY928_04310 [Elusimicrobia bacterium]|nr:hypothetical protein [Elusimicrobiota bacterium]
MGGQIEPVRITYSLTRRQRLAAHLGVWRAHPLLLAFHVLTGTAAASLAVTKSWWWAPLAFASLWSLWGFFWGFLNVAFLPVHAMDIIVEEHGIGFMLGCERIWCFLDGIRRVEAFAPGLWTLVHHNGTVISIPMDAVDERTMAHIRKMSEWGRTPEGVQASVARGEWMLKNLGRVDSGDRSG